MRYLFPAAFFGFICWAIVQANLDIDSVFKHWVENTPNGDFIGHMVLYGFLAFLLNIAMRLRTIGFGKLRILTGSLLVGAFALIEEYSQLAIATRNFSTKDLLGDLIGIVYFSILALLVYPLFQRPKAV